MSCRTNFCKKFSLIFVLLAMAVVVLGLPQAVFAQNGVDDPNGFFQFEGDATKTDTICFLTFANGGPAIATPVSPGSNGTDSNGCPTVNASGATAVWSLVTYGVNTDDWSSFSFTSSGGGHFTNKAHSLFTPSFISDPIGQKESSFLGTSTKDIDDITAWTWNAAHQVQDKDDIEHAYAGAYQGTSGSRNGHTIVVAGMDRFGNSGDSTAGFWFVQDSTFAMCTGVGTDTNGSNSACTAGGTFVGTHFDGDLLIVSDFSVGGAVSTINIFKWQSGSLVFDTGKSPAPCDPVNDGDDLCGAVNNRFTQGTATKGGKTTAFLTAQTVPTGGWGFSDKGGLSAFATGEFLEIGVDLNVVLGSVPCFSKFFAETRSSTSATASLSDLTKPVSFPLCSLSAGKTCSAGSIVTLNGGACLPGEVCDGRQVIRYPFSGNVNNTGSGTIYSAKLTDNPPTTVQGYVASSLTINGNSATPGTAVLLSNTTNGITSGSSASYTGTLDSNVILGSGALNSISVTASSDSSGAPQNVGPGTADWGDPSSCGPNVTTGITVSKQCETCLLGNGDLHVQVTEGVKACNDGNTTLNNLVVRDCRGGTIMVSGSPPNQTASCSTSFTTLSGFPSSLSPKGTAGGTDCAVVNVSYNPNSNATCSNGNCTFTDSVIAEGDAAFSTHELSVPKNASCNVCPINTSCPTITF